MSAKKSFVIVLIILFFGVFVSSVLAQESTSTASTGSPQATSTAAVSPEIATSTPATTSTLVTSGDTTGTATSTPATSDNASTSTQPTATSTPASSDTAASSSPEANQPLAETPPVSETTPPPPPVETPPAPVSEPSVSEPPPSPPAPETPAPPAVQPVVPFISTNGKGFDPAVAPSIVRIKVLNPDGGAPTAAVFVSFIGVGGRSYGGPLDREGTIQVIMPSGRYYADFLVVDTHYGPPTNPPAFFLEANEERDLGVIFLTGTSAFTDAALEAEVAQTLSQESGMAKIFALIVKLLLAILKEIRGLRLDMLMR